MDAWAERKTRIGLITDLANLRVAVKALSEINSCKEDVRSVIERLYEIEYKIIDEINIKI